MSGHKCNTITCIPDSTLILASCSDLKIATLERVGVAARPPRLNVHL